MYLLLIEDDTVIARELLLRWRSCGWTVDVCSDLAAANAACGQDAAGGLYDLIVLDLGLPDGDGVHWLMQWRLRDRQTPIIVLTARDRVADRILGLNSGADDYLVKPFDPDELDARIDALQRRSQAKRGESLQFGRIRWLGEEGRVYVDNAVLELMPREFEVLGLLIARAPRMLTKRALVDSLAQRNIEVGDSAAEVYVSRLRPKLAGCGATIRTLRGFGYVLELVATADAPT